MLEQNPSPGTHLIRLRGDCLSFRLRLPKGGDGQAFLRTNLDRADVRRREILAHAEQGRAILARDWHDVPMTRLSAREWQATLPLLQTGCFRAKAFFLPAGEAQAAWPAGDDVVIKVEPDETACGNTIYTVFPRQFGPDKGLAQSSLADRPELAALDDAGYAAIPPSGTFRQVIRHLDFIVGQLGFRILQLLPIHPVPTTFGRMGRFGSPFAATDFFAVDPALAEFDRRSTPLEQFRELVDAAHARAARVFIDLPANHTGWAAHWQTHHPEWYARQPDGQFESPGAWGTTWADLCKLDYRRRELWSEIAKVFLFWCRQGVDGFRCDAGYMVPLEVWTYVTAKVRNEFPDCVFLLEGLGGPLPVVQSLLTDGNLNWAYSELFQNYSRSEIGHYLPACRQMSGTHGTLVHFAETHDNDRLAGRSPAYARMRSALSALFADAGSFGITNGVEWFATEKVDVHGAAGLNWGAAANQVDWLARLTAILELHPAFRLGADSRLVQTGDGNALALLRQTGQAGEELLVLVNLEVERTTRIAWPTHAAPTPDAGWHDLLSGRAVACQAGDGLASVSLAAAEVLCLSPTAALLPTLEARCKTAADRPERSLGQRRQATALEWLRANCGFGDLGDLDPAQLAAQLEQLGPREFCRQTLGHDGYLPLVEWNAPTDRRRTVLLPPAHFLLVQAASPFLVELREGEAVLVRSFSLPEPTTGGHFALLAAPPAPGSARSAHLHLAIFPAGKVEQLVAPLLRLPAGQAIGPRLAVGPDDWRDEPLYALCVNELGGMAQVAAHWGCLHSQYDGFLVANLHPQVPVDRTATLRRLRGWMVCRDFSQELNGNCQTSFAVLGDNRVRWSFDVPVGQGKTIGLTATLAMAPTGNRVEVEIERLAADARPHCLADELPVKLILRPDIEDRNAHGTTRAMDGPEQAFPAAVRAQPDGFAFDPSGQRELAITLAGASFVRQPEWQYMAPQPYEATRGLAPHTDLFSPGYFQVELSGAQRLTLVAAIAGQAVARPQPAGRAKASRRAAPATAGAAGSPAGFEQVLLAAMRQFVVRRDAFKTVVAGYPWFLDWGRDTLICLRGLIAAGWHDDCRDILLQFARFEKGGTLPNMIRGDDDSNRDTSDAPLWFLVAVGDFLAATDKRLLKADCGGRPLLEVLVSIAEHYLGGTANGIRVDPDSGLVFSPSHFTWMDTNHPAGTPREGYPIEIQALWQAGLGLLARLVDRRRWGKLAAQVRASIARLYVRPGQPFLSDCLHARPGQAAAEATADDHCRPNQLLAITLGAIDQPAVGRAILAACEPLLVPGAIRSLADAPVRHSNPVRRDGRLLNDPNHPYWGRYEGDEDTRRKPAYHNGTAWTWQFPLYPEAMLAVYGESARPTALALLLSSLGLLDRGCLGQLPEIVDGDAPHTQRGCGAQAWGATELYRVWKRLAAG